MKSFLRVVGNEPHLLKLWLQPSFVGIHVEELTQTPGFLSSVQDVRRLVSFGFFPIFRPSESLGVRPRLYVRVDGKYRYHTEKEHIIC